MSSEPSSTYSPYIPSLLDNFRGTMSDELPNVLPPLRDIQHANNLVSRSQLPNILHYKINIVERAEVNRQLEGLLERFYSS